MVLGLEKVALFNTCVNQFSTKIIINSYQENDAKRTDWKFSVLRPEHIIRVMSTESDFKASNTDDILQLQLRGKE